MNETRIPEVGDILESSWGYDQTNIDFYKVLRVSASNVWIQKVSQEITSVESWGSENVIPTDQPYSREVWDIVDGERVRVLEVAEVKRRKFKTYSDSYYVNINDYASARPWRNRPVLQTHWH
jgi:hypothetical protein